MSGPEEGPYPCDLLVQEILDGGWIQHCNDCAGARHYRCCHEIDEKMCDCGAAELIRRLTQALDIAAERLGR